MPANKDELISESKNLISKVSEPDANAYLTTAVTNPSVGVLRVNIVVSGTAGRIKTTETYNKTQTRRKITYSNTPGINVEPGQYRIDYTSNSSTYDKNIGESDEVTYTPYDKLFIQYNPDSFESGFDSFSIQEVYTTDTAAGPLPSSIAAMSIRQSGPVVFPTGISLKVSLSGYISESGMRITKVVTAGGTIFDWN